MKKDKKDEVTKLMSELISNKEIDKMVAEKIMGWIQKELPNNDEGLPYTAMYWIDDKGEKMKPVNFFNPSSDLEEALEVAKTFEALQLTKIKEKEYISVVSTEGAKAHSSKPAMAICLACLIAIDW